MFFGTLLPKPATIGAMRRPGPAGLGILFTNLVKCSGLAQSDPITLLLQDFARGNKAALDRLVPLLNPELRKLARFKNAVKRGGSAAKVPFDQAFGVAAERPSVMIAIDD